MQPEAMFGPLDILYGYAEYVLLVLVLINSATRLYAHKRQVHQYRSDGADAVTRFLPHDATNVLLLLTSFYYMTVAFEPGVLATLLVMGVVVTDFFEFEARKAEARTDRSLEAPKSALAAWGLAAGYIAYRSLFFIVEPVWELIVA